MYFEYLFVCFVQIMAELKSNGVNIYHFPTDDQTVADTNNAMNVSTVIEKHKHIVVSFVCLYMQPCAPSQETSVQIKWKFAYKIHR